MTHTEDQAQMNDFDETPVIKPQAWMILSVERDGDEVAVFTNDGGTETTLHLNIAQTHALLASLTRALTAAAGNARVSPRALRRAAALDED